MSTIFDDFDFSSWASPDFLKRTGLVGLDYEDVLLEVETNSSMEAAFALCWQSMDARLIPDNDTREANIERLSVLVDLMRPQYVPDGDQIADGNIMHAHLSVGLALMLEKDAGGESEKFWELLDDALRTIRKWSLFAIEVTDDESEFSYHIQKSLELLEVMIDCKLFHRYSNERQHMKALGFLKEAAELAMKTDSWGFGFDNEYPFPTIGTSESGSHLIAFLVPEQKAVAAFESLLEDKPEGTNWSELASYCHDFQRVYEDLAVQSVYSTLLGVSLNSWDFWPTAYRSATLNLSPDEYYQRREEDIQREAEKRLRSYFFHENWDSLTQKARAALISADNEYGNLRGRRHGIFEDLWLAAREIVVESLVRPYNQFRAEQRELKRLAALAPALNEHGDLHNIVQALFYAPLFEEFLRQTFDNEERTLIKGLEKSFRKLNNLRNDAVHADRAPYRNNNFESKVRETYSEFLGIGCPGLLPRLTRIRP